MLQQTYQQSTPITRSFPRPNADQRLPLQARWLYLALASLLFSSFLFIFSLPTSSDSSLKWSNAKGGWNIDDNGWNESPLTLSGRKPGWG